jgi:hypothetical protein
MIGNRENIKTRFTLSITLKACYRKYAEPSQPYTTWHHGAASLPPGMLVYLAGSSESGLVPLYHSRRKLQQTTITLPPFPGM